MLFRPRQTLRTADHASGIENAEVRTAYRFLCTSIVQFTTFDSFTKDITIQFCCIKADGKLFLGLFVMFARTHDVAEDIEIAF